ncbi:META domain-containing protein [Rhodobacteraceae bacterium W635]|uniref:META domain-containing protein n=1 Tax=Nioella halotolerans TaxID=2303578 RepID=UPI000E3C14A3|nr:META domain-containing protein [Rhodobacteraceae bacterium W635]
MLRLLPFLTALLILSACLQDETLSGYGDGLWALTQQDGAPVTADITLDLRETGQISGAAPCNGYSAAQTAPYPWVEVGPITATRRACPDLTAEQAYFDLLSRMTLAEVSGPALILSNDSGETLTFRRVQP